MNSNFNFSKWALYGALTSWVLLLLYLALKPYILIWWWQLTK